MHGTNPQNVNAIHVDAALESSAVRPGTEPNALEPGAAAAETTPRPSGAGGMSWNVRFKLAIVLSFCMGAGALIWHRIQSNRATPAKTSQKDKTPLLAAGNSNPTPTTSTLKEHAAKPKESASPAPASSAESPPLPANDQPKGLEVAAAENVAAKEPDKVEDDKTGPLQTDAQKRGNDESPPALLNTAGNQPEKPEAEKPIADAPPIIDIAIKDNAKPEPVAEKSATAEAPPRELVQARPNDIVAPVSDPAPPPSIVAAKPSESSDQPAAIAPAPELPAESAKVDTGNAVASQPVTPLEKPDIPQLQPAPTQSGSVPAEITPASIANLGPDGGFVIPNAGRVQTAAAASESVSESASETAAATPASRSRAAATESLGPVTHVVKRGENFWTISRHYYGSGRYYKALWAANKAVAPAPEELYVGQSIRVPVPEDLDARWIVESGTERRTSAESKDLRPTRQDEPAAKTSAAAEFDPELLPTHRVRKGETLRSIAREELGDSERAEEIVKLNSDMLDDPPRLRVGVRLKLPQDARRR